MLITEQTAVFRQYQLRNRLFFPPRLIRTVLPLMKLAVIWKGFRRVMIHELAHHFQYLGGVLTKNTPIYRNEKSFR